jgi:hypothetical protein
MTTTNDVAGVKRLSRTFGMVFWLTGAVLVAAESSPAPAATENIRIEAVEVKAATPTPNLLPNASFEQIDARGIPVGWQWERGKTNAKCLSYSNDGHSGRRCIKLVNGTNQAKDVYGMLWNPQPVKIKAGVPYTLSAWVKSDLPGIVQLIGGGDWQFRVAVPPTNGQWRRIGKTFTPEAKDCDVIVRINTESPTLGVLVDDVKLEEGGTPTIDAIRAEGHAKSSFYFDETGCNFSSNDEKPRALILGSGPFSLSYQLSVPRGTAGTLDVTLSTGEKFQQPFQADTGTCNVVVKGTTTAARDLRRTLSLQVTSKGKEVARIDTVLRFFSADNALVKLAAIQAELPSLKKSLDDLKARGQDVSYPLIRYTILENSIVLAREDAQKNEIDRSFMQIDDMEQILANLKQEVSEGLAGKKRFPAVPRWTGDERPIVKSSSFMGPARTPGGKATTRPIFFNGFGHFYQPIVDMEKWPNYGMNIIQIGIGPEQLFPKEGVTDETQIQSIRETLDRAQKSGVGVSFLFCSHYFPEWALAKWPHLKKHREGWLQFCLHAPEGQELLRHFITTLITPIANHPALHDICLTNEPNNIEEPCEPARAMWRAWLEKHHKNIKQLNLRYGSTYASFAEVPLPNPCTPEPAKPLWMDFVRFNQEFFADWHKILADAVHKVAPNVPVHAKVIIDQMVQSTVWPGTSVKEGLDATLFGQISNINGCDALTHYNNSGPIGEFVNNWRPSFMGYDLMRSVLDAPVMNTENHMIWDKEKNRIPANHIREILWQEAIHGQSATAIWVWERCDDPKSDLYGNIMYRPACTEAVGVVNCDLNRAAHEVTAIQQAKPDVFLLHSVTASVWDAQRYDPCLLNLYTALSFTGLKPGFITERQLEGGMLPETSVIFVPDITHLSDAAVATLHKFKGHLVFVGNNDILAYDDYGRERKKKLRGEPMGFGHDSDMSRSFYAQIQAKMHGWNLRPAVELQGEDKHPVWGVEWRSAKTSKGLVVNVCNYLKTPVTVSLVQAGQTVTAHDVLTGERVDGAMKLLSLETRILRLQFAPKSDK